MYSPLAPGTPWMTGLDSSFWLLGSQNIWEQKKVKKVAWKVILGQDQNSPFLDDGFS